MRPSAISTSPFSMRVPAPVRIVAPRISVGGEAGATYVEGKGSALTPMLSISPSATMPNSIRHFMCSGLLPRAVVAAARNLARLKSYRALVLEQPALALETAAEAGERSVGADHAMTRHDDADRIRAVRVPDGADGVGATNAFRELRVGERRADWNRPQRSPHATLKLRAAGFRRQRIQCVELAGDIRFERVANRARTPA